MFYNYFLKTLTEEEYSVLYLIAFNAIVRASNYEPGPEAVPMLRVNETLKQIDKLKKKATEEGSLILESLIKKIQEYNA